MKLFVVADKMILGKGVFGVFTTHENAFAFMDDFERKTSNMCEIKQWSLMGTLAERTHVYAAHVYDDLHGVYVPDGIYVELDDAYEVAGNKGMIIRFAIDVPDDNAIIHLDRTAE